MNRIHKNSLKLLFISAFIFIFCGLFFCNVSLGGEISGPGAMGYGPGSAGGYWNNDSSGYGSGANLGLNQVGEPGNYVATPSGIESANYGNDVVTGNVGGGSHFRGSVPYSSVYNFGGSLQTTSLDGFIRYSTPSNQQFYSQTGSSGISSSSELGGGYYANRSSKIRYSQQGSSTLDSSLLDNPIIPSGLGGTGYGTTNTFGGYLSDQSLLNQGQGYRKVTPAEQMIFANQGIDTLQYTQNQDILKPSFENSKDNPVLEPFSLPTTVNNASQRPLTAAESNLASLKMQIISEMNIEEFLELKAQADENLRKQVQENWQNTYKDEESKPAEESTETGLNMGGMNTGGVAGGASATPSEPFDVRISEAEFAREFDKQIAAGDKYMSQGKYYAAADAYTYACLYKPGEYSAYIRKSIALLGAGEYVNSSKFLKIGIKISKDLPEEKIDVASMFPDNTIYVARLQDVAMKINEFKPGDLYLLYAYMIYQEGKVTAAQSAANQDVIKLEDAEAAEILKARIDKARN